jgi:hypothetical protein
MGGRVPVPVDVFSLVVEDDTLAKPFALNPSKTGIMENFLKDSHDLLNCMDRNGSNLS